MERKGVGEAVLGRSPGKRPGHKSSPTQHPGPFGTRGAGRARARAAGRGEQLRKLRLGASAGRRALDDLRKTSGLAAEGEGGSRAPRARDTHAPVASGELRPDPRNDLVAAASQPQARSAEAPAPPQPRRNAPSMGSLRRQGLFCRLPLLGLGPAPSPFRPALRPGSSPPQS